MEFRKSTQYSAQGSRNCVVGQFGQHLVSSSRGKYIAVRTRTYQYVPVCTELYLYKISTYKYILVCTAMYCHELVYTMFWCSMPTSRISRLWPTCPITRMSSCASCVSMPVLATFSITRPCSRKFTSILRQTQVSRSLSISTTLSYAHWLTAITMCPVNRGSDIHHW